MNKIILIYLSLHISNAINAQQSKPENKSETNKIETIKVINGDTVLHDVKLIPGNSGESTEPYKVKKSIVIINEDFDWDIDELTEFEDAKLIHGDSLGDMVIERIDTENGEQIEVIIIRESSLDQSNNSGRKVVKVIKMEKDEESTEDDSRVEWKSKNAESESIDGEVAEDNKDGLKVYPNPAKDEINLSFRVHKGNPAYISVTDLAGKIIIEKTFNDQGEFNENINLNNKAKGAIIINLRDNNREISKKIIIE